MENQYEAKEIGNVRGLGTIYQAIAPLPQQILALEKAGVSYPFLITPEETCRIRLTGLSNDFTRTSFAPVAVKGEKPILYKASPLMNLAMARMAVNAHANGQYPAFDRIFYEAVKEIATSELGIMPEDKTAQVLQSCEDYDLTPEMDDTKFILGIPTAEYFRKFNHNIIRFLNLPTNNLPKDKCAVNYLWFGSPEDCSGLGGRGRGLGYEGRAFGVRRKTSGAGSQNLGYTTTEIRDSVRKSITELCSQIGLTGIEKMIASPAEQITLRNLRKQ